MSVLVRFLGRPLVSCSQPAQVDAVVVLGSPLRADGELTAVGAERVNAGIGLWRQVQAPLLVMTGGRSPRAHHALSEAEAMAAEAIRQGVPSEAVVIEGRSRTTHENAQRCAELLLPGRTRVVLVTQPFHLRRAVLWFRRAGFDAHGHLIRDSLQFREPARGLRWVLREYLALARDLGR
jgi:uncharacterized SAM-binding protein YcdF (DUF218 family)